MIYAALAPEAAMRSTFGEPIDGDAANVVVRSWGALIALIGGLLIYGAFHPAARSPILTFAAQGKICFIALVLSHGGQFLGYQAGVAVVSDFLMVLLFAAYLVEMRRGLKGAAS